MSRKLKVGVVPYLNAKPIIYGLEKLSNRVELLFEVPSKLPRLLEERRVDVALIPAIECLRGEGFITLPGISISSRGPVESVRLFLRRCYVDNVKSVALDESSRTSVVLTRIILKERYGLNPQYFPWQGDSRMEDTQADAVLLIGDNAMRVDDGLPSLDLGEEWHGLTGLPFVYALWTSTSREMLDEASHLLQDAKERGREDVVAIALRESTNLGLEPDLCIRYLTKCIRYDLGKEEIKGLQHFYDYAQQMGLVPDGVKFELHNRGYIRESTLKKADRF
ncbi:MAG: menaquinone biosynthetic enzyme MqnA/MqnD family protein [Candidatus Brocadiales bacterium]